MKRLALPLLALALIAAAPAPHRWAIGGVPAERTSMAFIDLAGIARSGDVARTPMLMVQRDPIAAGQKPILYSSIDAVFDCAKATLTFVAVRSHGPDGSLVSAVTTPSPAMPLPAGSSFAASAEVACSGKARAADAPMFATDKLAVDYAQRLLHGERPTDRAL